MIIWARFVELFLLDCYFLLTFLLIIQFGGERKFRSEYLLYVFML
jgi:hypothetical protein